MYLNKHFFPRKLFHKFAVKIKQKSFNAEKEQQNICSIFAVILRQFKYLLGHQVLNPQ